MVQKERLLFELLALAALHSLFFVGCSTDKKESDKLVLEMVDTSMIPADTVLITDSRLVLENGLYYYQHAAFSGFIKEMHDNHSVKSLGSYYLGMQHGVTHAFYSKGTLRFSRMYKDNVGYGRHVGYWENGNMQFDFLYVDDRREGLQKQWYENGSPYAFLTFKEDKENGMQNAWRENGKPYINYEAKDGFRYGLQKAALCYTLRDEQLR
ncbi:MAG: hypothetical protein SH819_03090 [Cytophagales bacterium]|nr:hypothetical protein [Cytophagales bacterium]